MKYFCNHNNYIGFITEYFDLKGGVEQSVVAGLDVAQLHFDDALNVEVWRKIPSDLALSFVSNVVHWALVGINFHQQILQSQTIT